MLKWQDALNKNTLFTDKYCRKALTQYKLNSGEAFTYGYGWLLKEISKTPS